MTGSEQVSLALGMATVDGSTIDRGETVQLVMSVANLGPSPATQTTQDLPIPAGIEVTGHTQTHGSCAVAAGVFHCDLDTIPVGMAWLIHVDLRGVTPGTRDMFAHADGAGTDTDALHTNHFVMVVRPVGDVSIELAESADPIQVGT